jgi:hypothetical protein
MVLTIILEVLKTVLTNNAAYETTSAKYFKT